jgi:FKBP-type peptidyl-prolyl cis-trans isomerase
MASTGQRVIALTLALVFFVTSVGIGLLVVWQAFVEDNSSNNAALDQSAENQQTLAGTQLEGFTPVEEVTELEIIDVQEGDGREVQASDSVTVDYTGAVAATGIIFQSSKDFGEPVSFSLDGVIEGWTKGVPGMKEGGTRRLVIPAELAYGDSPPQGSGIPEGAALVFDITLHAIDEPQE